MPEVDGFEVAKRILAMQKVWRSRLEAEQTFGKQKMKWKCPVIAVTANQDTSTRQKAEEVGIK